MTVISTTTQQVPFVDLAAQQAEILPVIRDEIEELLATAAFIGGPAVDGFERAYAGYTGTAACVGVGNGTDAIELALRAVGVGPGSEVVLPANTFVATAEAVARIGATPVLVDVDTEHLLLDPIQLDRAITAATKAIVPVHLYGQLAPIDQIQDIASSHGVAIIEDAAQSQGARRQGIVSGAFGTAAATSFYPGKNLGAAGDAGAVTTNNPEIADRVRMLGAHGSASKYVHDVVGVNSRLDAIQAVVLRAKLERLDTWNAARRAAADRYDRLLSDVPEVRTPCVRPGNEDVWHLYVVQVGERDRVLEELQAEGIGTGIHYPSPVHLTNAFRNLGRPGDFPVAERAAGRILSLPMFPHLTPVQQERVVDVLANAVTRKS
ncbi:erythromycin biosynthesis sensory transduction protein eryC1 [Tersicoccus phoenicis]|uniref:Erythromycin biosynthesis sensory transduction protein eryC1 n=1 Tax=Tersicoccus phoenicis TaxID=554083 RepID=A0A1R1L8K0_9MICC|nr:DegT/DnrJ/EryC1/StrS family aminotransferase [Tersicoccus phoenicis]OMH23855.1 erythromycin biosynthesis sensory transduction protein eryC1 [Tersicoccus phoenicis]